MLAGFRERFGRWRERRAFRWSVDLALFAAAMLAVSWWQTRGHVRGELPELTLQRLGGGETALSSLRGRPVVLAFWAPWCGVCKEESPNLSRAARWLGSRAQVVSVAGAYEHLEDVQRSVDAAKMDYPVLLADDATLRAFQVQVFPTLYFVDAQGHIAGSASGYTTTLGLVARLLWL